jgi:hypothetical protein
LRAFYTSVLRFNGERVVISCIYPVTGLIPAAIGWHLLSRRDAAVSPLPVLAVRLAIVLAMLSALPEMASSFTYYAAAVCVLAAVLTAGLRPELFLPPWRFSERRLWVLVALLALLIEPAAAAGRAGRTVSFRQDLARMDRLCAYAGSESVVVLTPYHPICAYDATRLYTMWEHRFARGDFRARYRVDWREGFARQVMEKRPAVITAAGDGAEFFVQMRELAQITPAAYDSLRSFVDTNYARVDVLGRPFYIRKDRLTDAAPSSGPAVSG